MNNENKKREELHNWYKNLPGAYPYRQEKPDLMLVPVNNGLSLKEDGIEILRIDGFESIDFADRIAGGW